MTSDLKHGKTIFAKVISELKSVPRLKIFFQKLAIIPLVYRTIYLDA